MTINDKKVFSNRCLAILGCIIEDGEINPDPERLRPLKELFVPINVKTINWC